MMEANLSVELTKQQYAPVFKAAKFGRTISTIVALSFVCVVITGVISLVVFPSTLTHSSIVWPLDSYQLVHQKLYHLDSLYIKNPDPRLSVDFFFVAYMPFDTTNIVSYATIFLLQLYVSVMSTGIHLILDSFVVMLILHVCGQLELIQLSLTQLGENVAQDRKRFQAVLKSIVRKHQSVCQFVNDLEKLFNFPWFVELVSCTLMFCFQGYNVLKLLHNDQSGVFQIGFIIFSTFGILTQFLLNCWAGECLISQSSKVGYAFYCSKWYELRPSEARSLMIMGFQKTRPLKLSAWKFSTLSVKLFLQVMKTSFSYLSVLLVVTDF